ncbi:MAG: hypothetical protein WKG06_10255 [Segetibacter sp.]
MFFSISFFTNAQTSEDIQWSKNGNSYYTLENNILVQYQLPSLERKVIIDSLKLIPAGQEQGYKGEKLFFQ